MSLYRGVTLLLFCCSLIRYGVSEIEFELKNIRQDPLYHPDNRMEHAERNTSAAYGWWKTIGVTWIEWPGNITKLEPNYPMLKWGKTRAKLVQNSCNYLLGMDFKAYAYKYVHLTWGPFRLSSSCCPPMKVPREILKGSSRSDPKAPYLSVSDFEFVEDALLVVIEDRFILRIGDLERAFLEHGKPHPTTEKLTFHISSGITRRINKLVTQNCCRKRSPTCTHGETVLAYNEGSSDFIVFISGDGGYHFEQIQLRVTNWATVLHAAVLFPTIRVVLVVYGNETYAQLDSFNSDHGSPVEHFKGETNISKPTLNINGKVRAMQLGEEFSFAVWDECRVSYSQNAGVSLNEAKFYIHNNVGKHLKGADSDEKKGKHYIRSTHCYLAESTMVYDHTGKVGLLDSMNNFFYGIDTKTKDFPLVGTNIDMTLLLKGKENTIVPYFDFNNRPKLMYPPRYLVIDDPSVINENYSKRLGMRLFPRSVFPSDFIQPFFEEHIPKKYRKYGFPKCQTSSLSVDSSISQKPKMYSTAERKPFDLIVEFKSFKNESNQLHAEPKLSLKYLQINSKRLELIRMGSQGSYYYKYRLTVIPKPEALSGNLYRLNFYTDKSVRCVHQPQVTIWVKIVEAGSTIDESDEYNPGIGVDSAETSAGFL